MLILLSLLQIGWSSLRQMDENQLRYLLALLQLPGIGPASIARIQKETSDLSFLFNKKGQCLLPLEEKLEEKKPTTKKLDWSLVDADLEWARKPGCSILTLDHPLYPERLKNIQSAPAVLYVQGNPVYLNQPQIAIVGSRNPSREGELLAFEFAEYFSSMGLIVTSGLALGIDAAAHRGALEGIKGQSQQRPQGATIAVLGNGLSRIYPKSHAALSQKIIENGALVSEFSVYEAPDASHFPRRNRIISGLSLGTLVVEAALKSGSLITAQYAVDQGREVFAIPGSIHNPLAKGCHQLIQQGAKLIQTAEDVLEELKVALKPSFSQLYAKSETEGLALELHGFSETSDLKCDSLKKESLIRLLNQVSYGALSTVDDLLQTSGLTVALVSSMLLELELMGLVASVPGGYTRLNKQNPCRTKFGQT